MNRTLVLSLLSLLSILSLGCSNKPNASADPATESTAAAPVSTEAWFCQMSAAGDGEPWSCVQNDELARDPKPERVPTPSVKSQSSDSLPPVLRRPEPPPDSAPSAQTQPSPAPDPAPTQAKRVVQAAPNPRPPDRSPKTPSTPSFPYIDLAYAPAEPVSLLNLPPTFYAVQLTALSTPAAVEKFVSENRLLGLSAARVAVQQELRYALILGIYESEPIARQALTGMPKPLERFEPWLRKMENLQAAMLDGNRLAAGR